MDSNISTLLLAGAGAVIPLLLTLVGFLVKDRIKLRNDLIRKAEEKDRELLVAKEMSNKEHLANIENRLGFGSEKFSKFEELVGRIAKEHSASETQNMQALNEFRVALSQLALSFVTKQDCRDCHKDSSKSFDEIRADIRELSSCMQEMKGDVGRLSDQLKTSMVSVRDLTSQVVNRYLGLGPSQPPTRED